MKTDRLRPPPLAALVGSTADPEGQRSSREPQEPTGHPRRADADRAFSLTLFGAVLLPSVLLAVDLDVHYVGVYGSGGGRAYDVAVSGNLAYLTAGEAGLKVIDLSNPAHPTVGEYDTAGYAGRVAVAGHYAYLAESGRFTGSNYVGDGLEVIDISNPANPQRVGQETNVVAWAIAVSGNYVCVVTPTNGLQVIDISDPTSPQRVGGYDTSPSARVTLAGNLAYVADRESGLQVLDISNPASPQRVGGYNTSGDAVDVAVRGNYAYVAEAPRWNETNWIGQGGLQVIDVSDPTNPRRVGGYSYGNASYVVAVAVSGNYACIMADGLRIIDISDPFHPKLVGGALGGLPNDDLDTLAFSGDFVYVPDYAAGLHVFEIRPTTFDAWRKLRFSTNDLANLAVSGESADPDGDGFPNLAEYAFGLESTRTDTGPLKLTESTPGPNPTVTVSYERLAVLSDIAFSWEASADLLQWTPASPTQEQIGPGRDPSRQRVEASFTAGDQMRFFRLGVSRVPPTP